MRFVHLSDLHFGSEIGGIVDALVERIGEIGPDLVVASGDFTMAAREGEYRAARAMLERIGCPVLATPGNHDVPVYNLIERFFRPWRRYREWIEPVTVDRFVGMDCALLSVNSARAWGYSLNWSHGRLSRGQIDQADRFFAEHEGARFKALVVHHPFLVPDDLPGFRTVGRGDEMLDVLGKRGVDAVLTGHLHRQFTAKREVTVGVGSHAVTLLQVSTATSSRNRSQPNAFAVVEAGEGGFETASEVWDGERFERRAEG